MIGDEVEALINQPVSIILKYCADGVVTRAVSLFTVFCDCQSYHTLLLFGGRD